MVPPFETEISVNTGGTPMPPCLLRLTRFPSSTGFLRFHSDWGLLIVFGIIDATSVLSVSSVVNPAEGLSTQFIGLGSHKSLDHFLEANRILPA